MLRIAIFGALACFWIAVFAFGFDHIRACLLPLAGVFGCMAIAGGIYFTGEH